MSIIIGFGSTETSFEAAEEAAFAQAVEELYRESGDAYFSQETIAKAGKWLDKRAAEYRSKDAAYRVASDFPERYSSYYPHVLGDASHVVAVITFHHTNRRHPMSPDGWALMATKKCFCVRASDLPAMEEAA